MMILGDVFNQLGLGENELLIYNELLAKGDRDAGQIIDTTPIKRGTVYNNLKSLTEAGLIEQFDKNNVAHFRTVHPSKIEEILMRNEEKHKLTQASFAGMLPSLISQYNLIHNRPGVRYYEGVLGLKKIYDDINKERKDICLIRSVYDNKGPEIDRIVISQISKQAKLGIKTRAITPLVDTTAETVEKLDKERLVERKIIEPGKLELPGQIIIYSDKVVITDMKISFISTLIQNENIKTTFQKLFDYIWENS